MSTTPVQVKTYSVLPLDVEMALRFASCPDMSFAPEATQCFLTATTMENMAGRVCYNVFPVTRKRNGLDLGFTVTASRDLRKHLDGCGRVVVFAATVGLAWDRFITKYERLSPTKALLYQAAGAALVETLCDTFMNDLEALFGTITHRFSPGYGDLALDIQRDITEALDCKRKIGLVLNESLLMSPTKSVTAFVGIRS